MSAAATTKPGGERAALTRAALAEEIGDLAAARLIARWGGHQLPRRTPARVSREARDAQIRADLHRHTYRETARRNRCSLATVYRVASSPVP
jgi:Mor family transcriptional regulator